LASNVAVIAAFPSIVGFHAIGLENLNARRRGEIPCKGQRGSTLRGALDDTGHHQELHARDIGQRLQHRHFRKHEIAPLRDAHAVYDPRALGEALGWLLKAPERVDVRHIPVPKVTVAERLAHLRSLLRRGSFSFDDAVGSADRVTVAVTLFALLELYKQGELTWRQEQPFGQITVERLEGGADRIAAPTAHPLAEVPA